MNESRPGVTSRVISPQEALATVTRLLDEIPNLSVVGVAGPGDPLANPDETFTTLELVGESHPSLHLCLATNGIVLPDHLDSITKIGIGFVTVTVNAIDPKIGAKMVKWVVFDGERYQGEEGAALLWRQQRLGIEALANRGIRVKINTVMCPGINDVHIPEIAHMVGSLGAELMNITPLIPVDGTMFSDLSPPTHKALQEMRKTCSVRIPQMGHCRQCRADAAGLLSSPTQTLHKGLITSYETPIPKCENVIEGKNG